MIYDAFGLDEGERAVIDACLSAPPERVIL
jgi:hypothetical protein